MKYRIVLTVDAEMDGESPGEKIIKERIGDEIMLAIPSVLLEGPVYEDSPYAILINSTTLESITRLREKKEAGVLV